MSADRRGTTRATRPGRGVGRLSGGLLRRLAGPARADEVLGDLEEAHRARLRHHGRLRARILTTLEALDVARALTRERLPGGRRQRAGAGRGARTPIGPRAPRPSALDFKLGLRMLVRYPGLTVVGVFTMAFGIALGAGAFEFTKEAAYPDFAYGDGEGLVTIRTFDALTSRPDPRVVHDLIEWREELSSIGELGAYQGLERNLRVGEVVAPVGVVALTATVSALVTVSPVLGRALQPADEDPAAPPVMVLSHGLWQSRFGGDPDVVGRVARLGDELTTVVGVMPPGIEFPGRQDLWLPLRLDPAAHNRGAGPGIFVLGRLGPGVALEEAQAELAEWGARAATAWPDTHGDRRYQVHAYPASVVVGIAGWGALSLSGLALIALMGMVCANIALLLYARAAAREAELAVRSALGAGRGRIVTQLFAEAAVLAGVAAVPGLWAASAGLSWVFGVLEQQGASFPYWMDPDLSATTVVFTVALALAGATVAGVLPGLTVTGRSAQANLQQLAGRGAATRTGRFWSAVTVTQVAVTAFFVPVVIWVGVDTHGIRNVDRGLPADEYLVAQLEMDGTEASFLTAAEVASDPASLGRFERMITALEERLEAEPGTTGATFSEVVPGGWHSRRTVEVSGASGPGVWANRAQLVAVRPDFFEVMGSRVVAGRGLSEADIESDGAVVVVNESFVRDFLGGRNAVGRQLRYPEDAEVRLQDQVAGVAPEPAWLEIVGVVSDVILTIDPDLPHNAGIYHPLATGEAYPVQLSVHVSGQPTGFVPRLRQVAAEVDPALRVTSPKAMTEVGRATLLAYDSWFRVIVVAGGLGLLLTCAGIYAVISFTVARRTREIGLRVALGADGRGVAGTILARMARHVATGVAIGVGGLAVAIQGGIPRPTPLGVALFTGYAAVMMGVCMAACVVPARRALAIEPSEALAADG